MNMTDDRPTVLLDRRDVPEPRVEEPPSSEDAATAYAEPVEDAQRDEAPTEPTRHGPRRWNDPDEKIMLWGALFFFGLGLYAAAFVAFGMWLTP